MKLEFLAELRDLLLARSDLRPSCAQQELQPLAQHTHLPSRAALAATILVIVIVVVAAAAVAVAVAAAPNAVPTPLALARVPTRCTRDPAPPLTTHVQLRLQPSTSIGPIVEGPNQ